MAKNGRKKKELKSGISLTDLAEIYGTSLRIMKTWIVPIKDLGEIRGRALTPRQIKLIITHLDPP